MDLSSIDRFQGAVVTVMGLGRFEKGSGLGAAKWLIRHGAQTIITDLKDEQDLKESMDVVMKWYEDYRVRFPKRDLYPPIFILGQHRLEDFADVDCVVQNPGVPSESEYIQEAKKNDVAIESDVSLFFRFTPDPVIAITGTKGKTTVTKLVGEILTAWDEKTIVGGNIGISPLEYLDEMLETPEQNPTVLELSSWMLESLPPAFQELKRGPDIAVLTNVFPDHLNRYHSYGHYIHSKEIIFEWQSADQYTVLNWDHETVRAMETQVKGKLFWCSKDYQEHDGAFVKEGVIVFRRDGEEISVLPVQEVALKGAHNLQNVLAAVCASLLRGAPLEIVQRVLRDFAGVSDRQELVREVDEISYINDTTATNPGAVIAALQTFGEEKDIVLIAGGQNKGLEYAELAEEIVKTCKHAVLFDGDASDELVRIIADRVPVDRASSMLEAVQKARSAASTGDVVLLSPGAASFNMFLNEFDRGEQFREAVREL